MFSLDDVRREADAILVGVDDGAPLDARDRALITLAVNVCVTSFDPDSMETAIEVCLDEGLEAEAIQEIIALVSGLGVHSLMEGSRRLALRLGVTDQPLDAARQALWDRHVGDDPYWAAMEAETPGFLKGLIALSPDAFDAFFTYCAVPWKTRWVRAMTKELAAMACDASNSHRYRAGLRLHLRNALKLGAGRTAVIQTLELAAAAPNHVGL
jgi:alkylhydroperoxidase/carboxymuconolactone decarboxylase family protein YurZ